MNDSNKALNEVPALLEERRRYESWLAALEARRGSTPEHVFERVVGDYLGRLQRVEEQLASHRQAIEEERANVQSRLSLLEAEELMRRDERAELELRAHVGELVGAEADAAFHSVDDTIKQLVDEKEGLASRISDLNGLLEPRLPPVVAALGASAEAEAPPAQRDASNAAADTAGDVPREEPHTEERAPEAASPPAAAPTESSPGRPRTPTGRFDEIAFLHTVVGEDEPPAPSPTPLAPEGRRNSGIVRDEAIAASLIGGLDPDKPQGEVPLAANVTANHPIVLRATGSGEQAKTLKCNECGSMNYPTEWYCERCGAELAAL